MEMTENPQSATPRNASEQLTGYFYMPRIPKMIGASVLYTIYEKLYEIHKLLYELHVIIISVIAGILLKSEDVYFFSVKFFARY